MKSPPLLVARKRTPEGLIVLKTRVMRSGSVRGCPLYEYFKYVFPSKLEYGSSRALEATSGRNNQQTNAATVHILASYLPCIQPYSLLLCRPTLTGVGYV